MKRFILALTVFAGPMLLGQGAVHAEKADRDKPLKIEADKLDYDDLKQQSVFLGRVSLVKGSIEMRGDRLDVRQDPDGFQYAVLTPSVGSRSSYRQKRDIQNESVEGIAQRIEYDGKEDKIYLIGNAELKRYRGLVVTDELSGQRIVYENLTDKFTVDGKLPAGLGAGLGNASGTGGGSRVKAILSPAKPSEVKQ